jgi:patatin-like phospholipase/acyl hydrolase
MTVIERIQTTGPKKILTLDGGGIRGMIAVEVLGAIENLLREKLGKGPDVWILSITVMVILLL